MLIKKIYTHIENKLFKRKNKGMCQQRIDKEMEQKREREEKRCFNIFNFRHVETLPLGSFLFFFYMYKPMRRAQTLQVPIF